MGRIDHTADDGPRWLQSPRARAFQALSHRGYRRFFAGSLVVQLGFWLSHISFQGLMVELTDNSEFHVTLLFTALFLPVLVVAPFAGTAVDRFDRKRLLMACYTCLGSGALALSLAASAGSLTPGLLLVGAVAMGSFMAVLGPTVMAVSANAVPRHHLTSAVTTQAIVGNATRVVGPALAAPLVAGQRFGLAYLLYALACAAALAIIVPVRLNPYTPELDTTSVFRRFRTGIRHARERRPAAPTLLSVAVLSTFGVSHIALLPSFTEEVLGQPSGRFAWVITTTGAGAVVGSALAGSMQTSLSLRRAGVLATAYSLLLVAFAASTSFVVALVVQFGVGVFYFAAFTTMQAIVQQVVDDAKRGRVMSLFQICWSGLVPLGAMVMGVLADTAGLGARRTLLVTSSVCVAWSLTMVFRRPADR